MSKVATRTANTSSTANGRHRPPYSGVAASRTLPAQHSTPISYASRGFNELYRVDEVVKNGVRREVLVIEDTPPPLAGPSGSGSARNSHYESYPNHGPATKKRKAEGNYYDQVPRGAGTSHYGQPATYQSSGVTLSRNKRKLDQYEDYSNARASDGSRDSYRGSYRDKDRDPVPTKDKEGHFIIRSGDMIGQRGNEYRIIRQLGQGTFGKVVSAFCGATQKEVAIKIIRAVPKYREASKVEVRVLKALSRADPGNEYKCIHLQDTFDYKDHVCLVMELLGVSVFDFLKDNQYQPFPFSHIQHFAKQLLESVAFLHRTCLVHTDLKPENILLESSDYVEDTSRKHPRKLLKNTNIRLIDFGSATFESDYHANVVSTRHYRAPEIILGIPWSYPCDVWSIGCILIEFYTGEALFQTHENLEHLAMMEKVFGQMPDAMIRQVFAKKGHAQQEWFRSSPRGNVRGTKVLDFPTTSTSKQSVRFVKAMRPLSETVRGDLIQHIRFRDLLSRLLTWDPAVRITVKDALEHAFFNLNLTDEGSYV